MYKHSNHNGLFTDRNIIIHFFDHNMYYTYICSIKAIKKMHTITNLNLSINSHVKRSGVLLKLTHLANYILTLNIF